MIFAWTAEQRQREWEDQHTCDADAFESEDACLCVCAIRLRSGEVRSEERVGLGSLGDAQRAHVNLDKGEREKSRGKINKGK